MTDKKREEILTKAKPILFNTEMVRSILDGRKMVTRRVVKQCHVDKFVIAKDGKLLGSFDGLDFYPSVDDCLYQFGDILYVRETWAINNITPHDPDYVYKVDYDCGIKPYCNWKWRPSIHMPKEAARLFLRVTNVSVAKLGDVIL